MLFPSSITAITGSLLHEHPSSYAVQPPLFSELALMCTRGLLCGVSCTTGTSYTNLKPAVWQYFKSHFDLIKIVQFGGGEMTHSSFLPKVKFSSCKWADQPL